MANASLPQAINFTRSDVDAAITDALSKVGDAAWIRAIHRAAANLSAGQFAFDGQHVIIRSASSSRTYRISTREPMVCSCKAHERGLRCWHVVGARLLVRAAERHARQNDVGDPNIVSPMDARQNLSSYRTKVSPLPTTPFASLTAITNAELFG